MNKTTILLSAGLLLAASLAMVPAASAVDPCDAYGACVTVTDSGVFVGDCDKLVCAGVWNYGGGGYYCVGISYQAPMCT